MIPQVHVWKRFKQFDQKLHKCIPSNVQNPASPNVVVRMFVLTHVIHFLKVLFSLSHTVTDQSKRAKAAGSALISQLMKTFASIHLDTDVNV